MPSFVQLLVLFVLVVGVAKWYFASRARRRADILAGRPPKQRSGHAIIVGSGMAGLMVARVLSDFFEKVTILEKDKIEMDEARYFGIRNGVPQAGQGHLLMANGLKILNGWLPGFASALIKGGAVVCNCATDLLFHAHGLWKRRVPHAELAALPEAEGGGANYKPNEWDTVQGRLLAGSRCLYEFTLRKLVLARWTNGLGGKVDLIQRVRVNELVYDKTNGADGRRTVRGVRYTELDAADEPDTELFADLIVDASGKLSVNQKWLGDVTGVDAKRFSAQDAVVNHGVGYTGWVLSRTDGSGVLPAAIHPTDEAFPFAAGSKQDTPVSGTGLVVTPDPKSGRTRTCIFFPIEGNRWIFSLVGYGKAEYCPANLPAAIEWSKGLTHPIVSQVLSDPKTRLVPVPIMGSHKYGDGVIADEKADAKIDQKLDDIPTPDSPAEVANRPAYRYAVPPSRFKGFAYIPDAQFPKRFLPVGDAYVFVNPVFGAGMTMAAMSIRNLEFRLKEAAAGDYGAENEDAGLFAKDCEALQLALDRARVDLPDVLDDPWTMAAVEDLTHPTVTSSGISAPKFLQYSLVRRLVGAIQYASAVDTFVFRHFLTIFQMLKRVPEVASNPEFLLRVLYANLFTKLPAQPQVGGAKKSA